MPSVEELLSQDSEVVETYADTGIEYCTVDDDTRLVTVPDKYKKLGVESDEKAKRIWFRFPKLVGNNGVDLSAIGVRVNFRNANGDGDIYIVEDLTTDGDYVTFSWELTRKVTAYKGNVSFVVCAVKSATDGTIKNEWNTTLNKECEVLEGLEVTEQITQENPDIIEYILANLGGSVSSEQIATAVEEYMTAHPPSGMTAEEKAQLQKNTEDISSLSEEIAYLSKTGLTTAQISTLDGMFKKCAFTGNVTTEYEAFKTAFGISGEVEPDNPEVALSSISATYTGGVVPVGTALTSLTGITVTAHYSDGNTSNVTGYTLSGTIAEGNNTITVSYGGKTTTITVVGYIEQEEPTSNEFVWVRGTTESNGIWKTSGGGRLTPYKKYGTFVTVTVTDETTTTDGKSIVNDNFRGNLYLGTIPEGSTLITIPQNDVVAIAPAIFDSNGNRLYDPGYNTETIDLTAYPSAVYYGANVKHKTSSVVEFTQVESITDFIFT